MTPTAFLAIWLMVYHAALTPPDYYNKNQNVCPEVHINMCEKCKDFVNNIKEEVARPETQEEITRLFEEMCHQQQFPFDQLCLEIVHELLPKTFERIAQIPPEIPCSYLGFC